MTEPIRLTAPAPSSPTKSWFWKGLEKIPISPIPWLKSTTMFMPESPIKEKIKKYEGVAKLLGAGIAFGAAAPATALSLGKAVTTKAGALVAKHPIAAVLGGGILLESPKARKFLMDLPAKTFEAGKTVGKVIEGTALTEEEQKGSFLDKI
ncbi:unnamed protein product, partial [marine sediment metagenome]